MWKKTIQANQDSISGKIAVKKLKYITIHKEMKMKNLLSLFIIIIVATPAFATDNPWDTKLPFKSAIIDSKISGTMKGEKTLYIKDYGRTRAEHSDTTMKMFGMTQKLKEIIITTPDWVYTINLLDNTGNKQANLKKFMTREFNNLSKSQQNKVVQNAENQGIATIEGMEGSIQKNVTKILGYNCDKVTMAGTTLYTITGTDLALKLNGNMMGIKINQVATNVKKESPPSSKFDLPSEINFEHDEQADQMMQEQAKTFILYLLEDKPMQISSTGVSASTQNQMPTPPPQKSQTGEVLEQDAKDVGQEAKQDATIDEVTEGVRSVFKSLFD